VDDFLITVVQCGLLLSTIAETWKTGCFIIMRKASAGASFEVDGTISLLS
jgi:hypothetical protein